MSKVWLKDAFLIHFNPDKIAVCHLKNNVQDSNSKLIDINIKMARSVKQSMVDSIMLYINMLCFVVVIAGFFWLSQIKIGEGIIVGLRMLSGFFVFVSVFNRIKSSKSICNDPDYYEELNIKIWKACYIFGMALMFFTYIVNYNF